MAQQTAMSDRFLRDLGALSQDIQNLNIQRTNGALETPAAIAAMSDRVHTFGKSHAAALTTAGGVPHTDRVTLVVDSVYGNLPHREVGKKELATIVRDGIRASQD